MSARKIDQTDQLGLDEHVIEDAEVERALEDRQAKKDALNAARRIYEGANENAKGLLGRLELPDPEDETAQTAARVGRFRISKRLVKGRSVTFETKDKVRTTIGLIDDEPDEVAEAAADDAADETAGDAERTLRALN